MRLAIQIARNNAQHNNTIRTCFGGGGVQTPPILLSTNEKRRFLIVGVCAVQPLVLPPVTVVPTPIGRNLVGGMRRTRRVLVFFSTRFTVESTIVSIIYCTDSLGFTPPRNSCVSRWIYNARDRWEVSGGNNDPIAFACRAGERFQTEIVFYLSMATPRQPEKTDEFLSSPRRK